MTLRLRTTAAADEMAEQIDAWWQENRPEAPNLFLEELADAPALLIDSPGIGSPFRHRAIPDVRRFHLPRTRHHVYYVHDAGTGEVVILAIWGSSRGSGPVLRMR